MIWSGQVNYFPLYLQCFAGTDTPIPCFWSKGFCLANLPPYMAYTPDLLQSSGFFVLGYGTNGILTAQYNQNPRQDEGGIETKQV